MKLDVANEGIVAITTFDFFFWKALVAELGERAVVGTLEPDSSNILDLIEALYDVSFSTRHS